jgi:hypothetical protein
MQATMDIVQSPIDGPSSSIPVSDLTCGKSLRFTTFILIFILLLAICQLTQAQEMVLQFLRHLLPIISPSHSSSTSGYVMEKVRSDLDYFLPFRQHAPSLANARREIYADVIRLARPTGVGLFNILAFRGVFFGSPFATSDRFKWFHRYQDWERFMIDEKDEATKDGRVEEAYYVKRNCYGRSQKERSTNLLEGYWKQRDLWNMLFDGTTKPTAKQVYHWLTATDNGVTRFRNIGPLSALLICGDLVESGLVLMPSPNEFGELIFSVGRGAKDGMILIGLVKDSVSKDEFCEALESLYLSLQQELTEDEKEVMGFNIVMLEHTLCKIKRLTRGKFTLSKLQLEIQ